MGAGPIGGGGGSFDYNHFFQPKKKKEKTEGTEGSEAVVPKVPEPPPASPLKKSDGSITSISDTSNNGLGERPRGGHTDLYKKPEPPTVKAPKEEEATPGINIQDELTLSNEAQALPLPPLNSTGRATYESQARKYPPEEFHGSEDKLNLNG